MALFQGVKLETQITVDFIWKLNYHDESVENIIRLSYMCVQVSLYGCVCLQYISLELTVHIFFFENQNDGIVLPVINVFLQTFCKFELQDQLT